VGAGPVPCFAGTPRRANAAWISWSGACCRTIRETLPTHSAAMLPRLKQADLSRLAPVAPAVRISGADHVCASDGGARRAIQPSMATSESPSSADFTAGEREYIRRELDQFFSTLPSVAEGFQLRTWRGGPQKGHPKLPPPAKALVDRGLMRIDRSANIPRLFFTETGTVALRRMMTDRRFADPVKFAHVRRELGIDPEQPDTKAAE
jgi:hypothetical protein